MAFAKKDALCSIGMAWDLHIDRHTYYDIHRLFYSYTKDYI